MHKLRCWHFFVVWVQRMYQLRGWNLRSDDGGVELCELHCWTVFGFSGELLHIMRFGHISVFPRVCDMHWVHCGQNFHSFWCNIFLIMFELLGRFVLGSDGCECVHELCSWSVCIGVSIHGLLIMPCGLQPAHYRGNKLHGLPIGLLL